MLLWIIVTLAILSALGITNSFLVILVGLSTLVGVYAFDVLVLTGVINFSMSLFRTVYSKISPIKA